MKRLYVSLALFLAVGVAAGIAADQAFSESRTELGTPDRIELTVNSSASADWMTGTTAWVRGEIVRVVFDHQSASNGYSVTATDATGIDVLAGRGTNLSTSADLSIVPGELIDVGDFINYGVRPIAVNDQLSVLVTNMGTNAVMSVILYVRP